MAKFDVRYDGVYIWSGDGFEKLCSPLRVVALTRDSLSENWGCLVQWPDADGKPHENVIHHSSLAARHKDVLAQLLAGGLAIDQNKRDSVIEYILSQSPAQRLTIALHSGWHGDAFVLPDAVIQPDYSPHEIRYAPNVATGDHGYRVAGTADDWKREVGTRCRGNSRPVYAVSMAFSAPTLDMLGEDGGGSHIHGASSGGKTTTLIAAGSVWGGGGKDGFLKSWRSTSNALENVAAAHNDCLLPLDELGQLDPKEADRVAYLLAGGQSKNRMNADSSSQRQKVWRLQFLSTGEVTTEQQADSVGSKTRGGMEVRMVNIPGDAGKGLGAFENLHGMAGGAQFAGQLKEAALTYYGAVGREWLRHLTYDRLGFTDLLKDYIRKFEKDYMPPDAVPEVRRVVHRFAIIAAAGEVATQQDLTGWEAGEAIWGVATCLEAWLANRGGAGKGHDADQMLRQVRHFIQRNRESGFRELGPALQPAEFKGRTYQLLGYYRCLEDGKIFYLQTEIFRSDVCKGFDHRQVLAALDQASHLVHDSGRKDKQIDIGSNRRERFYAVKDSLLTSDDGAED